VGARLRDEYQNLGRNDACLHEPLIVAWSSPLDNPTCGDRHASGRPAEPTGQSNASARAPRECTRNTGLDSCPGSRRRTRRAAAREAPPSGADPQKGRRHSLRTRGPEWAGGPSRHSAPSGATGSNPTGAGLSRRSGTRAVTRAPRRSARARWRLEAPLGAEAVTPDDSDQATHADTRRHPRRPCRHPRERVQSLNSPPTTAAVPKERRWGARCHKRGSRAVAEGTDGPVTDERLLGASPTTSNEERGARTHGVGTPLSLSRYQVGRFHSDEPPHRTPGSDPAAVSATARWSPSPQARAPGTSISQDGSDFSAGDEPIGHRHRGSLRDRIPAPESFS
jgi:hypothetical protein